MGNFCMQHWLYELRLAPILAEARVFSHAQINIILVAKLLERDRCTFWAQKSGASKTSFADRL